mmetsp:Transcript_14154/g.39150  ORF Transcript_14154/g.39150 Transcript_14154/m.39150 type:complete len:93 (-) Transcript_14154:2144-2422(-)
MQQARRKQNDRVTAVPPLSSTRDWCMSLLEVASFWVRMMCSVWRSILLWIDASLQVPIIHCSEGERHGESDGTLHSSIVATAVSAKTLHGKR